MRISDLPPILATSWSRPKFQAQQTNALKLIDSPTQVSRNQDTPHTFTMASRTASRALRQTARQFAATPAQKRTFVSALRAGVTAAPKAAVTTQFQQTRGVKTIDFAGTKETVYGKFEYNHRAIDRQLTIQQSVPTGPKRSFL
jgi:hypothetical protein